MHSMHDLLLDPIGHDPYVEQTLLNHDYQLLTAISETQVSAFQIEDNLDLTMCLILSPGRRA